MDEPFGALDELTRMEMNDLLLDIRARTHATVVFVTHSISEAIYLSDQVLVFSKRPARIAGHIRVELPYPRSAPTRYVPQFTALERRASRALTWPGSAPRTRRWCSRRAAPTPSR